MVVTISVERWRCVNVEGAKHTTVCRAPPPVVKPQHCTGEWWRVGGRLRAIPTVIDEFEGVGNGEWQFVFKSD